MDILDKIAAPSSPSLDLNSFTLPAQEAVIPPLAASRNRAAVTAMLSKDPAQIESNFNLMMVESQSGSNALQEGLQKQVLQETTQVDTKGLISILSDSSVPLEQKQAAVRNFRNSKILSDQGTTLYTNLLSAESKGENAEQENARITLADALTEMYQARTAVQGLVNAHAASIDSSSTVRATAELTEAWIMPFGNSIAMSKVATALKKELGENPTLWDSVKAFIRPGSATKDIADKIQQLPPAKQVEFAQKVLKVIKEHSGILFSNDNQFSQFDKAVNIFGEGGYSDTQAFLDNISPLLDAIGIGFGVRGLKAATKATTIAGAAEEAAKSVRPQIKSEGTVAKVSEKGTGIYTINPDGSVDEVKRIELNYPVRRENPASPMEIANQTNPEKARNIHQAIVESADDEVANAVGGVSKEQAIVNNTMPQVGTESGKVTSKVVDIDQNLRHKLQVPDEIIDVIENTGAIYYTKAEKAKARANVVHDFQNASGLTINDAMSSFALDGGSIKISAVYGLDNGGFLRAEDAHRQAKIALSKYGIRDEDITILQKKGLDHVPVDVNNIPDGDGNYLVRVDTRHMIDPTDVGNLENFTVKRNIFDRSPTLVSNSVGSVTRFLMDAASVLHPAITGSAAVATDQSAKLEHVLLKMFNNYADDWKKLDSSRKAKVDEYIKEANFKELSFDIADLKSRGFNDFEINTLRKWREYWDAQFYLENYDLVRTLNSQGYELFKNANVELYVKPVPKNQNIGAVYDPALDAVVVHTKSQGDDLYNTGGTYARLRRPVDINGTVVENMIVRNTPSEYTRKLKDSDRVLKYREGYYQLAYNAPRFVDQSIKDAAGKHLYWKAIAVAGDTTEAEHFAKRMATGGGLPSEDFRVRGDERALQKGSDSWWDINSASGRIAQRHRGKLLEDGSGLNHLGDGGYIVDPVESGIRAARSISGRTVTRPMLEASKARAIQQYKKYFPVDEFGNTRWPNTVGEIGSKGEHTSKGVADARTVYEYINYLENGYINSADATVKALMNSLADSLGKAGFSKAERAINRVADTGPVSLAKNLTFTAYLAANPIRQWIVQTHQVVRTWAYNPTGWVSGSIVKYMAEYGAAKAGLKPATEFSKFLDDSGLLYSVDKQNLVRGALLSAADASNPIKEYAGAPFRVLRRVGFDVGEQGNLMGHAAAVFDKYKREGKNLSDLTVRDEAYSEIRAISYDMNFAGDLSYNQTTPAMLLQFMQVPHKAVLQMTNRRLDRATRAKLIAGDILMWGTPGYLISDMLGADILPEDPKLRETVVWGLESMVWNQFFQEVLGDDTNIDFSGLAPYDLTGWGDFLMRVREEGLDSLIVNSPAGQLFLKDTGQVRTAIKTMARYMNIIDDSHLTPTEFENVTNEVMKIASGWNNWQKAKLMLETGKKLDKYGNTIDDSATKAEAWAQLLGFGTASTRDLYRISKEVTKDNKKFKEEVLKSYKDIMQMYQINLGIPSSDPEFIQQVSSTLLKVYGDNPEALGIINRQFILDLQGKDQSLLYQMMKRSNIPDVGGMKDKILMSSLPEEKKKALIQRMEDIQQARERLRSQQEKESK